MFARNGFRTSWTSHVSWEYDPSRTTLTPSFWPFRVPTRGSHGAVLNNACYNTHDQGPKLRAPHSRTSFNCMLGSCSRDSSALALQTGSRVQVTYPSQLYPLPDLLETTFWISSTVTVYLCPQSATTDRPSALTCPSTFILVVPDDNAPSSFTPQ